jgi:hypothetical protein
MPGNINILAPCICNLSKFVLGPQTLKTKSFTVLHQVSWAPMYRCSTVMWHSIQCSALMLKKPLEVAQQLVRDAMHLWVVRPPLAFVASPLRPVHLCRQEDYLCKRREIDGEKEPD